MIRPLTRADTGLIQSLAEESASEGFRFVARFLDELKSPAFALDEQRQFFLGAFEGARLVAIGGVTPDPYVEDKNIGRLRHVYVARDARRQGVGRQLVAAVEQRARSAFTALRLRTDTSVAAAFYKSLGYQPTSEPDATHRRELATLAWEKQ